MYALKPKHNQAFIIKCFSQKQQNFTNNAAIKRNG